MRRMLLAVPLLLALAGCGGAANDGLGVATVSGTEPAPSASASVAVDEEERRQQFTDCMREQGVDMEDPEAGGGIKIRAGDKKTDAAMQKCRQYLPNGGEPPKFSAEDIEKVRQYAQCMRENGLPDFPDPDPETGMLKGMVADKTDKAAIDKANEKCKDKMPEGTRKVTK